MNLSEFPSGMVSEDGSRNVWLTGSNIQQPVDIQSRLATTIQTHNAVSVPANGNSTPSTWIDCSGYDQIAGTLQNDAATASQYNLLWSNDGVSTHGTETLIASGTGATKAGRTGIKARYCKPQAQNGDAAAHTMSAWIYLTT